MCTDSKGKLKSTYTKKYFQIHSNAGALRRAMPASQNLFESTINNTYVNVNKWKKQKSIVKH